MTPEKLDEFEKALALWSKFGRSSHAIDVAEAAEGICDALREAWRERDESRAELDRLRSGAELLRSRAMPRPAEKPVPTESERLRSLLMRAHNAICDGFLGGEWAIYVHQQEGITMAAAKEADEAEETLDLICRELSWARVVPNGEKAWQKIAARHAATRQG